MILDEEGERQKENQDMVNELPSIRKTGPIMPLN